MPLDALCLMPVADEIRKSAEGAKIDKIQQPGKNEIVFTLRGTGASRRLLVSASTGRARVHFTEMQFENPQQPPMFCMLLRKHLLGARIAAVTQPSMERVLNFELDVYDEMGVPGKSLLIIELIGASPNLILVAGDGRIVDCLRRSEGDMGEKRGLMPGLFYRPPLPSDKKDPLLVSKDDIIRIWNAAFEEKTVDNWLLDTFFGISPLICRELSQRFFGDTSVLIAGLGRGEKAAFPEKLAEFFGEMKNGAFTPCMLSRAGKPYDFSCIPITQYGEKMERREFSSFSELLDFFYTERDIAESARQRTEALIKAVRNLRDRTKRRLANQEEELKATLGRDRLREIGDIITANLHSMRPGMSLLRANDFYSEDNAEIEIRLDPRLSPQQNAARYYKEYNKAKNAERRLTELIEAGGAELYYLESVLDELSRASGEKDVLEIRRELEKMGLLAPRPSSKKEKEIKSKPLRFISSTGFEILVGKNNTQNDELTFRTAERFDLWLHTQKIHGSHVVIMTGGKNADDRTIEEAAKLAALYSQASESQKVPVDYTLIKHVRKPPGAKPGMAVYSDYKTIYATPDRKLADELRAK